MDTSGEPATEPFGAADCEARRDANARIAAGGDLIASLGHDYNNLFSIIIGSVGILEEVLRDEPGRAHDRVLAEDALSAAREASALLERLLECAGRATYSPTPVVLTTFLDAFWRVVERTVPSGIGAAAAIADGLGRVRVDAERLEKTLFEMVVNAREAMDRGGRLGLAAQGLAVDGPMAERLVLTPGRYVRIEVSDTGCGIADETLRCLYRPFFTTRRPRKGRGFGLAAAYGFARQAGGVLVMSSVPSAGTRASLVLPRLDD